MGASVAKAAGTVEPVDDGGAAVGGGWERDFGSAADTYPVLATEFGFMSEDGPGAHVPVIGDETYGDAIVDFFESKGISWTAWVFDPVWSPQLIENWDYEPTRQGRSFRDKLTTLNPER